ncbi:MAG: ABC transporter ATP-binding protein [Phycisphaerae bacterium]|jgi:putative ABC transport system ATP-binding protein|nr:ABC transporter ATP-binding protein [Phycisphaerae bacterium]MBT5382168.1 ABC transporter ATP-binding protein [Phycisphaerae bacterium]MBT5582530.1 ABC transporter ATP-binding protein [Phycisphaerae bacterium]MBT5656572.1 ABC transporter ATP-binding protein [Phycisphaerae bacterium]
MEPAYASTSLIEIRDLHRTYCRPDGTVLVAALRDINLTIARGQYVCIMGQSGSGKSTLMNIIGCLDRPTEGRYLLEGEDIANMDDTLLSAIRGRRIGFIFQSFNLIPELTVLENVEVPLFYRGVQKAERRSKAKAVLERVDLSDRLDHRPNQLSGGQQQRVAIARALVGDPSLLLADEPTGNLDTATGDRILKLLDELHAEGRTIMMITHDEAMADRSERVVRLRDGEIESDTAPFATLTHE